MMPPSWLIVDDTLATYPPLNTLKRVAENIWIVDGPVIRFGFPWPKFPFPTRVTVIRLGAADLFIHSPTPLTPSLRAKIEGAGKEIRLGNQARRISTS